MNTVKIIADFREVPSGIIDKLKLKNVELSIASLSSGDYFINNQLMVERKSAEDFIQSIFDNRLFDQCHQLRKKQLRSIIIIEGNPYQTTHKIDKQAIKGAILSILANWQIPVMFSKDKEDTVQILFMLGNQSVKDNCLIPLIKGYKSKKIKSPKLRFLQGLPLIGPNLADRLYNNFGSIESVITASFEDLMKIKGIGKKGAKKIRDFVA